MRSSNGTMARIPRLAAAALLVGLLAAAAGCSGSGGEDSGGTAARPVATDGREAGALTDTDSAGGDSGETARDAPNEANRAVVQTRAVIKTGRVAVTSKDLDAAREEVDRLLFTLGGSIDSEETSHDRGGRVERATFVLRVPVADFKTAMDKLETLGKVKSSDTTAKDVTTEVIDVNERVETTQDSLDRLQRFLRQSENIDDLIRFENEITNRESELRSLEAQQAYLIDQTASSTITLVLSTPEKYVAPPEPLEDAGFLSGLKSGWNALSNSVVVVLTVFGAVLPFAVALALLGVPVWMLVRSLARRRTPAAADPGPAATD